MPSTPCIPFRALIAAAFALVSALSPVPAPAQSAPAGSVEGAAPQTGATSIHMIDAATGTVLLSLNPDTAVPPASLTKIMTAELVFAALADGSVSLGKTMTVDEDTWRRGGAPAGGSTMFAALKSEIAVSDLLRGMIVQGGNDASMLLAQAVGGTEAEFTDRMNARAQEIGLMASVFANATGLPAPEARVTMRDMVALGRHMIETHPAAYAIFAEPEFTWNKITQRNRNPLLTAGLGVDGMMTGFVEEAGYSALISARRGSRRILLAAAGFASTEDRAAGLRSLVDWAFSSFEFSRLFEAGASVGSAPVFGGTSASVALSTAKPVGVLLPKNAAGRVSAAVSFRGPLRAPVEQGDAVAALSIMVDDKEVASFPVVASQAVPGGSLRARALGAISELAFGWLR
jgi:D-alanyl-D-alanine carboxypeptidase (penicillin-binding protein 5/6)